jgi:hypothetical protein
MLELASIKAAAHVDPRVMGASDNSHLPNYSWKFLAQTGLSQRPLLQIDENLSRNLRFIIRRGQLSMTQYWMKNHSSEPKKPLI